MSLTNLEQTLADLLSVNNGKIEAVADYNEKSFQKVGETIVKEGQEVPAFITHQLCQKIQKQQIVSTIAAMGIVGQNELLNNTTLNSITGEVALGNVTATTTVIRSKEVNAGIPKEGEAAPKKTIIGGINARLNTNLGAALDKAKKALVDRAGEIGITG